MLTVDLNDIASAKARRGIRCSDKSEGIAADRACERATRWIAEINRDRRHARVSVINPCRGDIREGVRHVAATTDA